ncbi:MAG: hypothetical protein ABSE28_00060 [Candidatus Sulfotelmatobacter sp.]|jgi:hypothetical protein
MPRKPKVAAHLVLLLLLSLLPALGQDKRSLSEDDVRNDLAEGSGCKAETVNINNLEHFDFTGDSVDEAVVVASTCATGTAGPDVHTVLSRRPNGSVIEFKIPDPREKQEAALLGRVFS